MPLKSSRSGQLKLPQPRTAAPEALIRGVGLLATLVGGAYLIWRLGWTIAGSALWLGIPLVIAEIHGYLTFLGYFFMTWRHVSPDATRPPAGKTVDFLIPTYNEPFSVLAPTIAGALDIRYPHKTYVLDDGRRTWVKELCERVGAEYITRPDNAGAKAGNLNHALAQTDGEYIAVVDADFVPCPDFIDDLLGYFDDPKLALVQGPQEFYNRDSFQHVQSDDDRWHEQTVFFRTIQPGKNNWNAAFWCGSPSLLRRSALDSVGGVAMETVTEDLHTTIRLHKRGWHTLYHPGTVALGIAPNDYDGFILQRLRWAEGTMQVIRKEWTCHGLSAAQVVNYLVSTGTYFDALRKAAFLAVVPLILIFDKLPIAASVWTFMPFWFLQYALTGIAITLLGRGSNRFLMTEFYDLTKMFAFIQASFTLLSGKRVRFNVTPKGQGGNSHKYRRVLPFAVLALIYLGSMAVGLLRLAGALPTDHATVQLVAVLWGAGISTALALVVVYGYRKETRRRAERVNVSIPGTYRRLQSGKAVPVLLGNLTTEGCAFQTAFEIPLGEKVLLSIGNGVFGAEVKNVLRLPGSGRLEIGQSINRTIQRLRHMGDEYVIGVEMIAGTEAKFRLAQIIAAELFQERETVRTVLPGEAKSLMQLAA